MLHVKGGTIVTADRTFKADILCDDKGRIASIAPDIATPTGCEVVDAGGLLVMPGGIDPHTHLEMPFMGSVASDDFFTGTAAGLAGERPRSLISSSPKWVAPCSARGKSGAARLKKPPPTTPSTLPSPTGMSRYPRIWKRWSMNAG